MARGAVMGSGSAGGAAVGSGAGGTMTAGGSVGGVESRGLTSVRAGGMRSSELGSCQWSSGKSAGEALSLGGGVNSSSLLTSM